ncbi:hypothetical protein BCR32DRAFT_42607 [Anaeromyces robustus]|uniref:Uncharacterized protein n=1 Tax=Anaeromyces robustus TaxID=1754192 RepID=A0A1Y1WYY4_9FUNG|nr:hypothetical protein BCR32DRAFT_42607 [Anaeromyces robustus]|eukprot:ORX78787.1 hypothetical protein BCR32DRAFT_42607 [Anaeromyces robustus]
MATAEERSNIVDLIKNCNISKLEKYLEKNGLTLNIWSVMFYMSLVETIKGLIKNNASLELINSIILEIKKKRNDIKAIIKTNDVNYLKKYIENNDISLKELKNEDFDILICSIENEASINMIKFIINQYHYQTLNYFNNQKNLLLDQGNTPLFFTLAKNNFRVSNLLLENGANINYENGKILCHLIEENFLNKKNLKYILSHGFNQKYLDRFIIDLIQYHTNDDTLLSDSLDVIFKYYLFDNNFILNLLGIYKNKIIISTKQLQNIIKEEQNKIIIKDEWYEEAIKRKYYDDVDAITPLIKKDTREKNFIINKFDNFYKKIYNGYEIEEYDNKEYRLY